MIALINLFSTELGKNSISLVTIMFSLEISKETTEYFEFIFLTHQNPDSA